MAIKQTMSRPINHDVGKIRAIVNEANDGIQVVPSELVIKAADDSTFTQISDTTPMPVKVMSGGGSVVTNVSLQNAATVAGNGTEYVPAYNVELSFEITGTSATRAIAFEAAGPSGVYVPFTAFNVTDPSRMDTGTTGGNTASPESWSVSIPVGWKFRARISAVAGGNVSISGKSVISNG